MANKKDYYKELDTAICEYENFAPYKQYKISWITDRIYWCNKFHKITEEQIYELTKRVTDILENQYMLY